jgi:hypothetical protein
MTSSSTYVIGGESQSFQPVKSIEKLNLNDSAIFSEIPESISRHCSVPINRYQFNQHFMGSFCANIPLTKQTQSVRAEKLRKTFLYEKNYS